MTCVDWEVEWITRPTLVFSSWIMVYCEVLLVKKNMFQLCEVIAERLDFANTTSATELTKEVVVYLSGSKSLQALKLRARLLGKVGTSYVSSHIKASLVFHSCFHYCWYRYMTLTLASCVQLCSTVWRIRIWAVKIWQDVWMSVNGHIPMWLKQAVSCVWYCDVWQCVPQPLQSIHWTVVGW